jgi:hypothetical protein
MRQFDRAIAVTVTVAATALLSSDGVAASPPRDTTVRTSSLRTCTPAFIREFSNTVGVNFGMRVRNLHWHKIHGYYAKRGSWIPIDGFRATFGGVITSYEVYDGNPGEYDWNIIVHPGAPFQTMANDALNMVEDRNEVHNCGGCDDCCIEPEVTPARAFRDNVWFPAKGNEEDSILVGRDVRFYGPWVLDVGHGKRPEIHPAEVIWFQTVEGDNRQVDMLIVQDASDRFDDDTDYIFDTNSDGVVEDFPGWWPWVAFPQVEEIKIPFQYDARDGIYSVVGIEQLRGGNVGTALFSDLRDSDDGITHSLKLNRLLPNITGRSLPTLVEVNETATTNVGVQFADLCKAPNGVIKGHIRVLTAIGYSPSDEEGYQVLRFRRSTGSNRRPVLQEH